ncbi:MAG: hypothetical protein VKJ04_05440 [Vampirovibrionales bacterium]|nr:hypothetical protein [Vampirovibrionales bacterium]
MPLSYKFACANLPLSKYAFIWDNAEIMDIRVLLEYDEVAQAYAATCPELNFVSSCGQTKEEAVSNLTEAIKLLLTPIPEHLLETTASIETVHIAL